MDLHFTADDEPLSSHCTGVQWRGGRGAAEVCYGGGCPGNVGAGQVNHARPRIVVLAASIFPADFGQMVVDAIHAAFQAVGRRHRGVAAVSIVMPKVLPIGALDQVGFGYAFYPIRNPRFSGGIGSAGIAAPRHPARPAARR